MKKYTGGGQWVLQCYARCERLERHDFRQHGQLPNEFWILFFVPLGPVHIVFEDSSKIEDCF